MSIEKRNKLLDMTYQIRETREDDFQGVFNLLRQTSLADNNFTEERFSKMLERNRGYCYVAEDSGIIIGNAFGTHDGAFVGYIRKVAVETDYRHHNIATQLITKILEKMDEIPLPLVFVHVKKDNEPSIELFRNIGFEIHDSHYLIDRRFKPK